MGAIKEYGKPLLTVLVALVLIHYLAPAVVKKHTGTA